MNNYRITSLSRQVGAIGKFQSQKNVQFCESAAEAYNKTREQLYNANREHVLIVRVEVDPDGSGRYKIVPPELYIYFNH